MIWLWIYLAGAAVWIVIGGYIARKELDAGIKDERTLPAMSLMVVVWPVFTLLTVGVYLAKKTPPSLGDKSREENE
jgi:hypothetical protein